MAPAYPKPIKPTAASLSTFPECFFLKINYPALQSLAFVSASHCCIKDLAGEASPAGFAKGGVSSLNSTHLGTGRTIVITDGSGWPIEHVPGSAHNPVSGDRMNLTDAARGCREVVRSVRPPEPVPQKSPKVMHGGRKSPKAR